MINKNVEKREDGAFPIEKRGVKFSTDNYDKTTRKM